MTAYLFELANILIPVGAGAAIVLYPMWQTKGIQTRTASFCLTGCVLFVCAAVAAARTLWPMELPLMQLLRLITALPFVALAFLAYPKRKLQVLFCTFIGLMHSAITVGFGLYFAYNRLLLSDSFFLAADIASLVAAAVTLPLLLYLLKRICNAEDSSFTHAMWRRIWLLPAIYFIAIVTSGAPFNPVSFHGTDFVLHRLLNYCTMLLICFVFLNGIKAEAATRKEQAAEAEKDTLERLRQMEASLIANIAHETKTPLAVLSGYAELIAGSCGKKTWTSRPRKTWTISRRRPSASHA